MKISYTLSVTYAVCLLLVEISGERKTKKPNERFSRQLKNNNNNNNADQMVQNILRWLQDVYGQQSRTIRQGSLREYLPPTNSQKPRPFEPRPMDNGSGIDDEGNFVDTGYPPAGSVTPQPPFTIYTNPATGGITGISSPGIPGEDSSNGPGSTSSPTGPPYEPGVPAGTTNIVPSDVTLRPENPTQGTEQVTGYPTRPTYQPGLPSETTERPGASTQSPEVTERPTYPGEAQSTDSPGQTPGVPEATPGYTSGTPAQETQGYPTSSPSGFTGYPSGRPQTETTGFPTYPTSSPSGFTGYTTGTPSGLPGFPTVRPTPGETVGPVETEAPVSGSSSELPGSEVAGTTTQPPSGAPGATGVTEDETVGGGSTVAPAGVPGGTTVGQPEGTPTIRPTEEIQEQTSSPDEDNGVKVVPDDDDSKHPPHIHALDVQCAKDMMTINIEFNRVFNGVIYSKGYYNMPECRYVNENSGQTKYTFTVNLNMCGTEFINAFDTEGRSYLENILVLQNELGIQEVWDTVRSVRCLWEGNLKEQLSVTLMVGMLSQEIVTFSGDTAMAKLDVVLGRGPFGQAASGLVKIGEQMTLVVSVSGDPGFDVQVKDCRATDSSGSNVVPLTDDNGCILKPKLFGSFQKTRNTGETGASIIAYAYFNAFKFPDVMDIMIECNIELCKTDCEMCPELNPQLEPAKRRKRDISISNETLHDSVLMAKHLRIVLPEDLASAMDIAQQDGVCMSTQSFVFSTSILISLLTASCLLSVYLWFTTQKHKSLEF